MIGKLQNMLTDGFINAAFDKSCNDELKQMETDASNNNPPHAFVPAS